MCTYILLALLSIASFLGASGDGAGCAGSLLEGPDGHLVVIIGEKHADSGMQPFHNEYKSLVLSHISQLINTTKAAILYEATPDDIVGTQRYFYHRNLDDSLETALDKKLLFSILSLCIPGADNPLYSDIVAFYNLPSTAGAHMQPCDLRIRASEVIIDVIYYHIQKYAENFKQQVLECVCDNQKLYSYVEELDSVVCTESVLYGSLRKRLSAYGIDCDDLDQLWYSYFENYAHDVFGESVTFKALFNYLQELKAFALQNSLNEESAGFLELAVFWREFAGAFDTFVVELCRMFEIESDEDLEVSWLEIYHRYCQKHKTLGLEIEQDAAFHEFAVGIADFGVLHAIFTAKNNNQPACIIIGDEHRKTLVRYLLECGYAHEHTEYAPRYRQDFTSRDCYLYPEQYDELFNRFYGAYFNVPGSQQYVQPETCVVQQPVLVQDAVERLLNF